MSNTVLPSNEQRKLLERATVQYSKNIGIAEEYLQSRAIPMEVARSVYLGVVDREILEYRSMAGRLAIPYITPEGPVNLAFRCIQFHDCKRDAKHPKYVRAQGLGVNLYNVLAYGEAMDYMCVTEGELDALSLRVMGIPAIGIPGAENWEEHWKLVFQDFERVFVFQDGDKAGAEFAEKYSRLLKGIIMEMPEKEDVNSMLVKQGYPFFKNLLEL